MYSPRMDTTGSNKKIKSALSKGRVATPNKKDRRVTWKED